MGAISRLFAIFFIGVAVFIGCQWIDRFDPAMVKGKRVLITGGSAGIGEQLAYEYARMGASVMVTARTTSTLKKVVKECEKISGHTNHHYVTTDMSHFDQIGNVIKATEESLGGLDILVINHITPYRIGWWTGKENLTAFEYHTKIDYNSYIHLAAHALPVLEKTPGSSIIVMSSIAAPFGYHTNAAYAGAKGGLESFFLSLRSQFEYLQQDTSVTVCVLGAIATKAGKGVLQQGVVHHQKSGTTLKMKLAESALAPVGDTAIHIIKAGALKQKELYYPYLPKFFVSPFTRPIYEQFLAISS